GGEGAVPEDACHRILDVLWIHSYRSVRDTQQLRGCEGMQLDRCLNQRRVDRLPVVDQELRNRVRFAWQDTRKEVIEEHREVADIVDLPRKIPDRPAGRDSARVDLRMTFDGKRRYQTSLRRANHKNATGTALKLRENTHQVG